MVATALASTGDRVLVTGRDPQRGRAAERDLREVGAIDATFLRTDHADLGATRHLAERVRSVVSSLDLLVLNAGTMPLTQTSTNDGLNVEVAVDVVTAIALVDGLMPVLTAAPAARVVLVTSDAATRFAVPLDEDPWQASQGAAIHAYARAKAWKLAMAAGLAEELRSTNIVVHAASPGPAWTPMTRAMTRSMMGVPLPMWWVVRGVQRSMRPGRAARCIVRAAVDPTLAEVTGQLVRGRAFAQPLAVEPAAAAHALANARKLARPGA